MPTSKAPTAREHDGFSAGSYKDLTRVAWLNPPPCGPSSFWRTKKNLLFELDTLIGNLNQYKQALEDEDFPTLCRLLDEGRRIKEEVDGNDQGTRHRFPAPTTSPLAGGCWPRWARPPRTVEGRTAAVVSDTHVAPSTWTRSRPAWRGGVPGAPLRLSRRGSA